ncbi:MAG: hypothetical protein AB8F26_07145 [Phycisphaerales bacterium]
MDDHRTTGLGWFVSIAFLSMLLGLTGGCSTGSSFDPSGNPLLDVRNPDLLGRDRIEAAEKAWAEVEAGTRVRSRTREAFKSLAWSRATEEPVRIVLIDLLMGDQSEEGRADSEQLARLMLPTERSPAIIRSLSGAAVREGWADVVPALVRSYARGSPNVPDADRPEREAIARLMPNMSVEEVVYRVFLSPGGEGGNDVEDAVLRTEERARDDAWTLLSRLDLDGRIRADLIGQPLVVDASLAAERDVEMLRLALRELGVLPRTGEELSWLRRLRNLRGEGDRALNAAWWDEASAGIARLGTDQRRGLELRHVEAVRWAATHQAAWISMDRSALVDVLEERLRGRPRVTRKADKGRSPRSERLRDRADDMSWGDVLTVLVADEALKDAAVLANIWEQVDLDRDDDTTEYGGIVESDEDGVFRAVLFRPRARDRLGDDVFVASGDMIRFSDRALTHYHVQVSEKRLSQFAGPSSGDLAYAAVSGRTCFVFTSIGADVLNVDVYSSDGLIIDLGYIER